MSQDIETPATHQPSWWHRDHPVFTSVAGFFTGLAFVCVVPAAFAGFLGLVFGNHTAKQLFPFVLVTLVVPIGLLVRPGTRTFGRYMLLGILLTAVVVVGVATFAVWLMFTLDD